MAAPAACRQLPPGAPLPGKLKDKNDATKYTSTSPRFNPHLSVQGDVLMGLGGAGVEGKPGVHYTGVQDTCVGCHMSTDRVHTFKPQMSNCVTCHADAKNFDVNGFQTEVKNRMEELKKLLTDKGLARCQRRGGARHVG